MSLNWIYLHQGGRRDQVTGLYDFRHRDYSSTLGRWGEEDPSRARYVDGLNLYLDELDNPVDLLDPQGRLGYIPPGGGRPTHPSGLCDPNSTGCNRSKAACYDCAARTFLAEDSACVILCAGLGPGLPACLVPCLGAATTHQTLMMGYCSYSPNP
jgi:RHS repeat-associated protein